MENELLISDRIRSVETKCDVIITMLERLSGDPDFLIRSLRNAAERQRDNHLSQSGMKLVRCDGDAG
jgi:hypothetical protein